MSRQATGSHVVLPAAPSARGRVVRVVDDPDDLESMRDDWCQLRADVPGPTSELDYVVAQARLLAAGERLQVVTLEDDGTLVGAAPLVRTGTPSRLRFFDSDANGFLYADEARLDQLVEAVLALRTPLFLECVVDDSATAKALRRGAGRGWVRYEVERLGGPSLPVDATSTDPHSRLSTGRRADLRRAMRRAREMGEVSLEVESPGSDVARRFDELVRLEARCWKFEAGSALACDDRQREALRRYVTAPRVRDRVRVTRMTIGGEPAAIDLSVVSGGRLWGLKGGVDDRFRAAAPGLHLKALAIATAAEEGLDRYEFMGKAAQYKQMWGAGPVPMRSLRYYPPRLAGAAALTSDAAGKVRRRIEREIDERRGGDRGRPPGGDETPPGRRLDDVGTGTTIRSALRHPGRHVRSGPGRTVRIIDDPGQLAALRDEWRELDRDVDGPSGHIDWVLVHAEHRSDERLCVVTTYQDGRLTAAAPLMRSRGPAPRLHLAILDATGFLYRDEGELARLVDAVLALPFPLSLDLLVSGSPTDRLVRERMPRVAVALQHTRTAGASVDLDDSWRDPLDKLNSRRRNDLRRKLRKAERRGPVRFEVHAPGDEELEQHFARFVAVEGTAWKRREGTALADDDVRREELWDYLNSEDVRDHVRFATMHIGDRIAAADLAILSGDRYWYFKGGYDGAFSEVSPGVLLKLHTLAWAADQGLAGYEFMGDREPYKAQFGPAQEQRTVRVYGPNPASALALQVDAARKAGRIVRRKAAALERPGRRGGDAEETEKGAATDDAATIPDMDADGCVVRTRSDLGPWREAWDDLVLAAPLPSPFLRSWWLDHVATAAPRFVLVFEDERLIGGAALQEDRVLSTPRYRVLGHGPLVPDHLDAVAAPDRREQVESSLRAWCARPGRRLFDLDGVVDDSLLARVLPGPVNATQVEQARYRELPADPAEIVPSISGSERTAVKRGRRKLAARGAEHRVVPNEEADAGLARLRHLHYRRWGEASGFLGHFPMFEAAARDGLRRGEVVLHELSLRGNTVCMLVEFHLAGRVFSFQDGRDPDPSLPSPGSVLQAEAMEWACRQGRAEYDFLRGSFDYKSSWTDAARPILRLRAAQGPVARGTAELLERRQQAADLKGRARRLAVSRWSDGRRAAEEARERRRHGRMERAVGADVRVLGSREELEPLRDDWTSLRTDVPTPTSELAWVLAYASNVRAHERLRVITVFEEGHCIAAAPLVQDLSRAGALRPIDDGACGFVYRDRSALSRLVDAVLALRLPLLLDTLPVGCPTEEQLRRRAVGSRQLVVAGTRPRGPTLSLHEGWVDPASQLSSGRRRDIRRRQRRAEERGTLEFEVSQPGRGAEAAFDELLRITDQRSQRRAGRGQPSGAWEHDVLRRYVRAPEVRQRIVLSRMRLDGRTVAADLGVIAAGAYWALTSRSDADHADIAPDVLTKVHTIGWAAKRGLDRYEFVRHDDAYERAFGAEPGELSRVRLQPANPAGLLLRGLERVGHLRGLISSRPGTPDPSTVGRP